MARFYRRFGSYAHDFTVWKGISAVVELAATVLVTFFYCVFSLLWPPQLAYSGHRSLVVLFPQVPAIT